MKKIVVTVATATLLATAASAGGFFGSDTETFVYLSGGAGETLGTDGVTGKVGLGIESEMFDTKVIAGYKVAIGYTSLSEDVLGEGESGVMGGDIDLVLGYKFGKISTYGIAGYTFQTINDFGADGFTYGAGVSYHPFESFGVAIEHKTGELESIDAPISFDYSNTELQLRFLF